MKIIHCDLDSFIEKTGMLVCIDEFEKLSIRPNDMVGGFDNDRLGELMKFCSRYPEFHIVSYFNTGLYANRIDESAIFFSIANGDRDRDVYYMETLKSGFVINP